MPMTVKMTDRIALLVLCVATLGLAGWVVFLTVPSATDLAISIVLIGLAAKLLFAAYLGTSAILRRILPASVAP